MIALHLICPHGTRHKHLGQQLFESGAWTVSDERADELTGGRLFLHEHKNKPAWHGGTVQGWRPADDNPRRKIFTYRMDGDFRVLCTGKWGQD